jgi:hypothetical protein
MIGGLVLALTLEALGPARAISHSSSAARDTFVLGIQAAPRPILSGGGEFAVLSLSWDTATLRLGGHGMLELESDGETRSVLPFPRGDTTFWRGVWGYSAALSLDAAARRMGPRGALEVTLTARHESEHFTGGSTEPGRFEEVRIVGDFLMLDGAARWVTGDLELVGRLQHKQFIPGRSAYTLAPGADLHLRWRRFARLHPFTSLHAEYLVGNGGFPDAYLVRDLAGAILPSTHGDLYLFVSAEVGHRKGLAVLTEEASLGFGVRFAFQ